jgi:hypothetical protein
MEEFTKEQDAEFRKYFDTTTIITGNEGYLRLERAYFAGKSVAFNSMKIEESPSRQPEPLVVPHATLVEIEQLKKDVEAWKQESEMYANAWQRELGGVYHKTHFIDALVVTTRAMKKQLNAFLEVAKKDFR